MSKEFSIASMMMFMRSVFVERSKEELVFL